MYIVITLILLLIIVVVIVILKPSQLDKARRAADEIIMTRQAKPQDIETVINDLVIFGLWDEMTLDSRNNEKDLLESVRKGKTWDEAISSMFSSTFDKAEKKDKERIDKLKALLKEIDNSINETKR